MKALQQLELWVKGECVHNKERGECTPDFSCCDHELLAPEYERDRFYKAYLENDNEAIDGMLMVFLGRLLKKEFKGDDKLNIELLEGRDKLDN